MEEQTKRGPGRPHLAVKRQHIDITISQATLDLIDAATDNRSQFIEDAVLSFLKAASSPATAQAAPHQKALA